MNKPNKRSKISTKYFEVAPNTKDTIRVLEETLQRIKTRQDEPNIVFNILRDAMGELVPLPCGEMFEKHQLMRDEPIAYENRSSRDHIYAAEEVERAVASLKRDGIGVDYIQVALLDEFMRLFPANPYRDPVDVEAIEADYFNAEFAINRLDRMMEDLYKALNRAAKSS